MVVKPSDLPSISENDQLEIRRREKNIDKAIKLRWTNTSSVLIPAKLFGHKPFVVQALKGIYISAGWSLSEKDGTFIMSTLM